MNSADRHWSETVRDCEARGEPYVIVTMLGNRGSTPRDAGTKMVLTAASAAGTIGGGQLEFAAQTRAGEMLAAGVAGQHIENFPLGEKLGQCCGGSTSLLFECFVPELIPVLLFGAGHVGRALAPILAALPLQLRWIDSRADEFPQQMPDNVITLCPDDLVECIGEAPRDACYLIMTHQHPLDYALMEAALRREDEAYIGVIGSSSKWRRFRMRLEHRGFPAEQIDRVHCPIGLESVPGKRPAEIAVAVAAQLIAHYHARRGDLAHTPGPTWRTLSRELAASASFTPETTDET